MKKYFFYAILISLFSTVNAAGQATEGATSSRTTITPAKRVFKVYNSLTEEKNDQFEIQGLGGTTFTASNMVDGSTNSYIHSLRIVVSLVPVIKTGNPNFRLVFYSPSDNIQEAATYSNGTLNIYFPEAVYEDIKTKLEQAFATKKKVMVKVIQKPDGYREGTLVL